MKIKRIFIKPNNPRDAKRAAELERILNSPGALREIQDRCDREVLMVLLWGPDRGRWPN